MAEAHTHIGNPPFSHKIRRGARRGWLAFERAFDLLMDTLADYISIMAREFELFLGSALFLAGVFNFQNGKNCDGNTANYISCTNPSTFYYYNWLEVALIVIGVFFIMLWVFRLKARASRH